jgi:hypothetical protein
MMTDSETSDKVKKNLFKFMNSHTKNIGDVRNTLEQVLYDNGETLSIKLFNKKSDKVVKVTIKQISDDKFGIRIKKNEDVSEKEINMKELKKYLGDNKDMTFALNYINKDMTTFRDKLKKSQTGGAKKRKSSKKKGSRKKSKKGSRKKSKKGSRKKRSKKKGTKKKSKKGSRKKSKKGSRKKSKKRSKKKSRKKSKKELRKK